MRRSLIIRGVVFTAIFSLAIFLRARDLGTKPPTGDEGESSINALTILQHGGPVDHYLRLPIFENTLTEFSPADPEYEFRGLQIVRPLSAHPPSTRPFPSITTVSADSPPSSATRTGR